MLWYGMLWDWNKNASIYRRDPNISKKNCKKPKFSTNLQCEQLHLKTELKLCLMLWYDECESMRLYAMV